MTEDQLDDLEALCDAASPGPWLEFLGNIHRGRDAQICHYISQNNAAFVVAAREAVPELIAEVRRLRERVPRSGRTRASRRLEGPLDGF